MIVRRCIVCAHAELEPTEPQTCVRCLGQTRRTLIRVEELHALLPYELAGRAGAAAAPRPEAKTP